MGVNLETLHLLRRAGFGLATAEATAIGSDYGATVDDLIGGLGRSDPGADAIPVPTLGSPLSYYASLIEARRSGDTTLVHSLQHQLRDERVALTSWWLARMVATTNPLTEKLTFLLHGHFPTGISKVRIPAYMYGQNQLFRRQGPGRFDDLTQAVATDPAMLIWLDASSDKAVDPNENFARELMERFTMGIGTYHESDVRQAAYCFTGWRLDRRTGAFTIDQSDHSPIVQQVLGMPVNTGTQVIDLVTHSPASARFVPAAMWSHLAYPVPPSDPVVTDLAPGYAADLNLSNLLRTIFEHPQFVSKKAMTGLVKQPTEYVVGALRALGASPSAVTANGKQIQLTMAGLGQILFDPPSVGGWSQNAYWLSTSAALARWTFAEHIVSLVDLSMVADATPSSRLETIGSILSVPNWSSTTAATLQKASGDPAMMTTLALVSPEYVVN